METVGAYEAKTQLSRLLERVEAGGTVVITKHGRPIARLVPASRRTTDVAGVAAALRAARRGVTRGDVPVREMLDEGRRA